MTHKPTTSATHLKKKKNHLEYLLINIFVFAGIGILSLLVLNISFLNSFKLAFEDFTLTDIFYNKIQNNPVYNGPVVLVNLEKRNRGEIADLIHRVEKGKPKVVGIDSMFPDVRDTMDVKLKEAFEMYPNLVLPYIDYFDEERQPIKNDPFFNTSSTAYVNIEGEDPEFSTIRNFYSGRDDKISFTGAILEKYDPTIAEKLLRKKDKRTEIKFYGNLENFRYYNYDEVNDSSFDVNFLKNKIVLIGYLGNTGVQTKLDEDRFFTPLNPRLSGRSHPDMYGMVIHANILRMALEDDYVHIAPKWLNIIIAFVLSLLVLPYFIHLYVHKPVWFHLETMLIQVTMSILFVFLTILLYAKANIKVESSSVLIAVLLLGDFVLIYDSLVRFFKHKLNIKFHSKFFEGAH
ncbi:hypothetical protein BH09BAC2_BH09BAC2_21720 [soil metagenome]